MNWMLWARRYGLHVMASQVFAILLPELCTVPPVCLVYQGAIDDCGALAQQHFVHSSVTCIGFKMVFSGCPFSSYS